MTTYRLPRPLCQRVLTPELTIEREGATLHRFNISTSGNPAHKWFNENQLIIEEESIMNKYAKRDKIVIGDMTAIYDTYTKDKTSGEITMHYLKVEGEDSHILSVTASQMRDLPEAEPFAVGTKIKHEHVEKPIAEVRFPFYKLVWQSSANNTSTQWLHHDKVAPLIIESKPESIEETEAPDIEKALYTEMLTKIESLKAQLETQSATLAKLTMEKEQLERDVKKAKNNVAPIGEVDAIRAERDSLRSQVAELGVVRKERDQLRSQLAVLAQEKPQPQQNESGDVAIVVGETASGMAKRKKEGYAPIHMQFEGGKLNVVYERTENTVALPVERHAAITIPARQSDYASALNNRAVGADELSAIGNAAIMQAGANIFFGKKEE